jgi:hypothetical protein
VVSVQQPLWTMCNATNGRLDIAPNGTVTVDAEGGTFSNARCFTSLDGCRSRRSKAAVLASAGASLPGGWPRPSLGPAINPRRPRSPQSLIVQSTLTKITKRP